MHDEEHPSHPSSYAWTQANAIKLADRIHDLKDKGGFQYKHLVIACGLVRTHDNDAVTHAQERFSRWHKNVRGVWDETRENQAWKKDAWRLLSEDEFYRVTAYVMKREGKTSGGIKSLQHDFPDLLFHGVRLWLESTQESLDDLRQNFEGVYAIYRHSLIKPGNVLVGCLTITYLDTGVVTTKEHYRVDGTEEANEKIFELDGYIFRKNKRYYALAKHVGTSELQTLYFDDPLLRGGRHHGSHVVTLSGVVFDSQGHDFYATRFVCARATEPPRLEVMPFEGVPDQIKRMLEESPTIKNRVVKF